MFEATPELNAKLAKFRDAYEWALIWLPDADGNAELRERDAWKRAKREVPLSQIEEDLFRRVIKDGASVRNEGE
jgi:hypothetical protein